MKLKALSALILAGVSMPPAFAATYEPSVVIPPQPAREFRAAWVASVANIDWPSKPGLSTAQQQSELLAILDRAQQLKLNAIILQVRPACDALYASPIEPWSEYLTGAMGKPPEPFWDPLAFAVAEAHKRGLELHAWFNPYRARHPSGKSPISAAHISKTRPQLVRQYGRYLWLDPGEKAVQDYSLNVVLDVVRRYDINGAHFDDYFYPYKEKGPDGKLLDFPDEPSWKRYVAAGGKLGRDDWRRENVNEFIRRVYESVKAAKPHVKFGVSPFGIWRPGHPPQIKGFDPYAQLYADSRVWLQNGWLDYFAPQLYWSIGAKEQSYPVLLKWWAEQNAAGRHLWPGMNSSKANEWGGAEIVNQIKLTRAQPGSTGHIHWNMKSLMQNRGGLADAVAKDAYAEPALVPASPWLDRTPPGKPKLRVASSSSSNVQVKWEATGAEKPWLWVLQTRVAGNWRSEILPAERASFTIAGAPEVIALRAVDRASNLSSPAAVQLRRK